jgi:hypothetical protein
MYSKVVAAIAIISTVGLSSTARADYFSAAPTPPSFPNIRDTWYISSSVSGIEYYGAVPYYTSRTRDGNFFISGLVMMKDDKGAFGSYIQIDCGRFLYRNLIPWVAISDNTIA